MTVSSCEPVRVWSRLELRTRQVELDRVLQARTADPLWLLTRQWQFGEFQGEDTGSAVLATLARKAGPVAELAVGGRSRPYDPALPLDAQVEQLPIALPVAARARAGRCFLTVLAACLEADGVAAPADTAAAGRALAMLYPLKQPVAAGAVPAARRQAAGPAQRVARALAGRAFDGAALAADAGVPEALLLAVPAGHDDAVARALTDHRAWFAGLFVDPGDNPDGWDDARLGYHFDATVRHGDGDEVRLSGSPAGPGGLDWHSFDLRSRATGPASGAASTVTSTIPAPAQFAGMPSSRWWQLEDTAVSLTRLRADAGDLTKLIATEFALLFGNDWLVVGDTQLPGTLVEIEGILVTDVFGHRTLVRAATDSAGTDWSRWDLFSLAPARERGAGALAQHLWTIPAAPEPLDGPVQEEATFLRDESSNTVWAVETRVPDGLGGGADGAEIARRVRAALGEDPGPAATTARLRYRLGSTVPENWIPFVPVHIGHGDREVALQRASMPRFGATGDDLRVRPVTSILRSGIGPDDVQTAPYYVNEEEVSRVGVVIRGGMRRARWLDGRTVIWHARRRATGRGSGESGLVFDTVESVPAG